MTEHPPALTPEPLSDRVRRGDLMATQCPSRDVLKHVTSRWGVLALMALEDNTLRFSALRQQIGGVSERMLAQTLQALAADGFVNRVSFDVVPPLGREVAEKVRGLADWIEVSMPRIAQAQQDREQG